MSKKAKTASAPVMTDVLAGLVKTYLDFHAQAASIKKAMDTLKADITMHADARYIEFVEGELILDTGKLKVSLNPPKMVYEQNEKTVEPAQRALLALLLPEAYRTVDLNVKLIQDRLNADKFLAQGLKGQGVKVAQDTRYDIKPLKG